MPGIFQTSPLTAIQQRKQAEAAVKAKFPHLHLILTARKCFIEA